MKGHPKGCPFILGFGPQKAEERAQDLLTAKTYTGLYFQQAILSALAGGGESWRLGTREEESKGIDGYVGETAYSVKPDSCRAMSRLEETIGARIICYTKNNKGITVEVPD